MTPESSVEVTSKASIVCMTLQCPGKSICDWACGWCACHSPRVQAAPRVCVGMVAVRHTANPCAMQRSRGLPDASVRGRTRIAPSRTGKQSACPARFPGVVGMFGAALLAASGLAAGGAWWGVAGLLHLSAGAGAVLLAAQAFALHAYAQHWCGPADAPLRAAPALGHCAGRPALMGRGAAGARRCGAEPACARI